jgi:putative ABC transport system permease protein
MDAVARRIGEEHPEEVEHGIGLFSQKELVVANTRPALLLLLGSVGLVLLIACANIANLLLVRATERRRELGVRQALGAGRGRLLVQHLSESVVLSLAGGAAGYLVAVGSIGPFVAAFPGGLPRGNEVGVDYRVLAVAAGLSIATGLATGVLPAIRAVTTSVVQVLQDGGRGFAGGRQHNRTQAALVVSEIALAFVLLAGAGLFVRSFTRLTSIERGFVTDSLLVMPVVLPIPYRESNETAPAFYQELNERLRSTPGVELVAATSQMPFVSGFSWPPTSIETSEGVVEDIMHSSSVTPEYFEAMGIPTVAGRTFDSSDRDGSLPVAVVNEAMVKQYWPDENPIGRQVRRDVQGDSVWMTVIGVVGDIRNQLNRAPFPEFFMANAQRPSWYRVEVIKTAVRPNSLIPAVREAVWAVDPDVPVQVWKLEDRINQSAAVASPRFGIYVLGALSALAGLLAIVGIYGVLAYAVQQRSQEIGIRMALGAATRNVLGAVLQRGLVMVGTGLALGLAIALAAGRLMESLLFEVSPADPVTMVAVALLVLFAALVASFVPARRATRVDPVEAMRDA